MELEQIGITTADWNAASTSDQETYRAAAAAHDIRLVFRDTGNPGELDVFRTVRPDEHTGTLEAFSGEVHCPRKAWEHLLRQLLGLDDPCFSAASH
jgi:hypothetical protein